MKHTAMNAAIGIPITTNAAEPASTVCLIALLILFFGFWFRVISYSGVHPPGPARTGQRLFGSGPGQGDFSFQSLLHEG